MPIERIDSEDDLRAASAEAGRLLQLIQDYCAVNERTHADFPAAKVRFPRGFIRTADRQRSRLRFIRDSSLRGNLAYTLILSDTVLWLSLRTDVWGVPLEMLTKLYAFLIGTLCESITKNYLAGRCGQNFKRRNAWMLEQGIIDEPLKDDLDWLWDTRNNMHLFQLDQLEYENHYDIHCHIRAVRTFRRLLAALDQDYINAA
jgi:hypothetical protein